MLAAVIIQYCPLMYGFIGIERNEWVNPIRLVFMMHFHSKVMPTNNTE